ncbi:hypothetical protein [Gorillibacterium massiliense]|uniref:hypothetical protein n=1 Tax=Gorillibacterium massiliense TaxID=1280390 RepID=UPI0004BCA6E2|nr:hypothetical protein [Gorillibacterium massiliense]
MLKKPELDEICHRILLLPAEEVIPFVEGRDLAEEEKFQLYSSVQHRLYRKHGEAGTLAAYAAIILDIANQYEKKAREADEAGARLLLQSANVLLYNLSADMAECWRDEGIAKDRRCFETGLAAASTCIDLRKRLNKDTGSFSIAYWAKGMHQLSLGACPSAIESFTRAFQFSIAPLAIHDADDLTKENAFNDILCAGYLGIAKWVLGDLSGKSRFEQAIALFSEQVEHGEDAEQRSDAAFGIKQLDYVRGLFIKE